MLLRPSAGATIPPWFKPIEALASEETDTPDPTSFPDDILIYLSTSHDEALQFNREDLKSHNTVEMLTSCPEIMELLTSDLAYDVFVPSHWTGIDMEPYHLDVKPGLPDHLKARSRPIRESLYHVAKKGIRPYEFLLLRDIFLRHCFSTSCSAQSNRSFHSSLWRLPSHQPVRVHSTRANTSRTTNTRQSCWLKNLC